MYQAQLTLKITFAYRDEYDYAETIIELLDRARERCSAEIVGPVVRGQVGSGRVD